MLVPETELYKHSVDEIVGIIANQNETPWNRDALSQIRKVITPNTPYRVEVAKSLHPKPEEFKPIERYHILGYPEYNRINLLVYGLNPSILPQ